MKIVREKNGLEGNKILKQTIDVENQEILDRLILENLSKKNLNKLIIYKPKYLKFLKQMDLRKQQKYSQIVYF